MKLTYRQVIEAQSALVELCRLKLPVRASLEIARLAGKLDGEALVFAKTRDKLVKDYSIRAAHTDKEDTLSFSCLANPEDGADKQKFHEEQLLEFTRKFNELLESETTDIGEFSFTLPDNIELAPRLVKPVIEFIEVG